MDPLACNHFMFDLSVITSDVSGVDCLRDLPFFIECRVGPCYVKCVLIDYISSLNRIDYCIPPLHKQ